MKLFEIVNTLQQIASAQPSIHTVYEGSVYKLNELKDIKYGACVITQAPHRQDRDFIYYDFIIYYVDRLTADASNKLPVQSTGIDTLANIVLAMDELGFDFTNINYTTFTQKFEAECAGAFAEVIFAAPTELCADWYDIIVHNIQAEGNGYSILDKYATKEWVEENFSGGTGGGVTPKQVQDMIDDAMDAETARTEETYLKEATLDGYATEQWVEDKHYITSADTSNFVTTADTANFITTADTEDFVTTADTSGFVTTADTQNFVTTADTENFRTEEEIQDMIDGTVSGYVLTSTYDEYTGATATAINNKIAKPTAATGRGSQIQPVYITAAGATSVTRVSSGSSSRYNALAVTDTAGNSHLGRLLSLHQASNESAAGAQIGKLTSMAGFTNLYTITGEETNELRNENQHFMVDSRDLIHIKKISQSDYDALVESGELDEFTLYLCVE